MAHHSSSVLQHFGLFKQSLCPEPEDTSRLGMMEELQDIERVEVAWANRLQGRMAEQHGLKVEMLRFGLTGEFFKQNMPFFPFYLASLDSMLLLRLLRLDCDHDGDLASKSHSSSGIRAAQEL